MHLDDFKIVAFTHKNLPLSCIGKLHLNEGTVSSRLNLISNELRLQELFFLSTCNRVEFHLVTPQDADDRFISSLLNLFYNNEQEKTDETFLGLLKSKAKVLRGAAAVRHCFEVASSLDSIVVGEREILGQFRDAYEKSRELGFTGDVLRLVQQHTVKTAKKIYTDTQIASKPVSVASLAARMLGSHTSGSSARILLIGAGQTAVAIARHLKKRGYGNYTVFNRSLNNAIILSAELGGKAYTLDQLADFTGGFDVLICCSKSRQPIITNDIYKKLLGEEAGEKIIIDLSVPSNLDRDIVNQFPTRLIDINSLKQESGKNMSERKTELDKCRKIIEEEISAFCTVFEIRKIERAMSNVPAKVKEIRETALNKVFPKEFLTLDANSQNVIRQILHYVEDKYISLTMKTARETLISRKV